MSRAARSVVIHGHFYQPPREDPWLDRVPVEPNAAPFHDWNQRIEHECYGPLVDVEVGANGGAPDRINALESLSFDFGPTLLQWMERKAPSTYAAVLAADRASRLAHGGFGNAIAAPYHHVILPLASRRDKRTEIRWGVADFRRRFGREPVGMWLPETAVDDETLDVLAAEGIAFTVLAPHQVQEAPTRGLPGLYRTAEDREIALFVYDGDLAQGVAFGRLLKDPEAWLRRLAPAGAGVGGRPESVRLVSLATDGETYGHHHRSGVEALATVLGRLRPRDDVRLDNFASFLARHPAAEEVELVEPSSWSCAHGVDRWRADCGCKKAPERESHQKWRAPLRESLEWLADELHALFEREAGAWFDDPWSVRDEFGEVVGRPAAEVERFLRRKLGGTPDATTVRRAAELLEMERDALRMFTSCGWFFDDLSGLEPAQVLRYAAHAIDQAGDAGRRLEPELVERLSEAPANAAELGDAGRLYREQIRGLDGTAAGHGA